MKNNALVSTNNRNTIKLKTQAKHVNALDDLDGVDGKLNKLWDMFKVQLERNCELMEIINKQNERLADRTVIATSSITITTPAEGNLSVPALQDEMRGKNYVPLTYEKLSGHTTRYKAIFDSTIRLNCIHGHISFLNTLYQLGGEADIHELFMEANVTDVTGYRYLSTLRKMRLIMNRRKNGGVVYVLTKCGRMFMDGELMNKEQYQEMYHEGWR